MININFILLLNPYSLTWFIKMFYVKSVFEIQLSYCRVLWNQHEILILTSIKLLANPNLFKKYLLYKRLSTKHDGFTKMKKKWPLCSQALESKWGECNRSYFLFLLSCQKRTVHTKTFILFPLILYINTKPSVPQTSTYDILNK